MTILGNFDAERQLTIVQSAYNKLLNNLHTESTHLSLARLLDIEGDERFLALEPHASRFEVEDEVQAFCEAHHIWHKGTGEIYNTMTAYLHPETSTPDLLAVIGKVYALLYYMDDYIGNEKQKFLAPEEQQQTYYMMKRLAVYLDNMRQFIPEPSSSLENTPIENAARHIIEAIWAEAEKFETAASHLWFHQFIGELVGHLKRAVVEQDSDQLLTPSEYIQVRDEVSGMKPAVRLMSYGSRNYIDRDHLGHLNLLDAVEALELQCIRYGGLVNDLFSFHKEVMEDRTTFNLVAVTHLNNYLDNPDITLIESIEQVSHWLGELKNAFFELSDNVIRKANTLDEKIGQQLVRYVTDLRSGVIATWRWQIESGNPRYARDPDEVLFIEIAGSKQTEH